MWSFAEMEKKYLIVEGYYDFLFYTALFNKLKIKDIKIISPQNFGFPYNGKGNAINLLKDLIKQFYDGHFYGNARKSGKKYYTSRRKKLS